MRAELLNKIKQEQVRYELLRQDLLKINHLRNKAEVDRMIELLMDSNSILAAYRKDYEELLNEFRDEEHLSRS